MTTPQFLIPMNEDIDKIIKASMPTIDIEKWRDSIIKASMEWNIFDERFCMFLAQIGHESRDLNSLTENLNYSVEALLKLFGRHRISLEDAHKYGRKAGQTANQETLANILYGGEWGRRNLGNTEWGDGWKYRGRGAKQITGKHNYKVCGDAIGVDLVITPELLERDKLVSLQAATWYFDTRTTGTDIRTVTKQINGGFNGLEDRDRRYKASLVEYNKLKTSKGL